MYVCVSVSVCMCVIFDGGDQKIPQITNAQ